MPCVVIQQERNRVTIISSRENPEVFPGCDGLVLWGFFQSLNFTSLITRVATELGKQVGECVWCSPTPGWPVPHSCSGVVHFSAVPWDAEGCRQGQDGAFGFAAAAAHRVAAAFGARWVFWAEHNGLQVNWYFKLTNVEIREAHDTDAYNTGLIAAWQKRLNAAIGKVVSAFRF